MRRLGRWMFNGLAALSLLLCVAVMALWVESHWRYDVISWSSRHDDRRQRILQIRNGPGCFYLESDRRILFPSGTSGFFQDPGFEFVHESPGVLGLPFGEWADQRTETETAWGLGFQRIVFDQNWQTSEVAIRFIWATAVFAALPLLYTGRWIYRRRAERRRRQRGRCPRCFYNLTGNVSGVCPECGNPISSKVEIPN
jgi:hypothetical protein